MRVSVVGGSSVTDEQARLAAAVGREIGSRGYTLVCGGRGGAMAAACRGASEAGGRTVGILPGTDPAAANEHVDVPVVTGLGSMRNTLVVRNGDAVVAVDGAYGTLSEVALALDADLPVVGLDTHDVEGVRAVETPEAALDAVERALDGYSSR